MDILLAILLIVPLTLIKIGEGVRTILHFVFVIITRSYKKLLNSPRSIKKLNQVIYLKSDNLKQKKTKKKFSR